MRDEPLPPSPPQASALQSENLYPLVIPGNTCERSDPLSRTSRHARTRHSFHFYQHAHSPAAPSRAACPITYSKFPKEAFSTGSKTTNLFNAVITEGVKQKLINATCQNIAQAHLPMCMADLSLQDGCCDKTCADALLLVGAREARLFVRLPSGWDPQQSSDGLARLPAAWLSRPAAPAPAPPAGRQQRVQQAVPARLLQRRQRRLLPGPIVSTARAWAGGASKALPAASCAANQRQPACSASSRNGL